jgi:hypothetical protein
MYANTKGTLMVTVVAVGAFLNAADALTQDTTRTVC